MNWLMDEYDVDCPFCQWCGDGEHLLNLHHLIYFKDRKVWEYQNAELLLVCENCHKDIHNLQNKLKYDFAILCNDGFEKAYNVFDAMQKFSSLSISESDKLLKFVQKWKAG